LLIMLKSIDLLIILFIKLIYMYLGWDPNLKEGALAAFITSSTKIRMTQPLTFKNYLRQT